ERAVSTDYARHGPCSTDEPRMQPVISFRRSALVTVATLTTLTLASPAAAFSPPPVGSPAQVELALAPAPEPVQPPAEQPPAGTVEGPTPPEVPEFENPIVAALQPVPGGLTSEEVARRSVESS